MDAARDLLLVIDELDAEAGLAEVEDSLGRTYQLPAEWLPGAEDGAAYRVRASGQALHFLPEEGGSRVLRERSKQTLLEFADNPAEAEGGPPS